MSTLPHSPVTFSNACTLDLIRSSFYGFDFIPLRFLERSRVRERQRGSSVVAKIKKWKKHDYPWSYDIDPNAKGGHLSHLSHFKPLKEKPKPVTLDFEKPLRDLEQKIMDVRRMADETGLDFSEQILSLEAKYQKALRDLYTHLTPIQRLSIARHPNRPTFLDHVLKITDKWVELHGDRAGYDDPAIVTGIGTIDGRSYMFIGHQKGRNTKENIQRNFGMPTPPGYRKALRMMNYADHHGFPIITFIDTPGAYADLKSEELGQGEAIAQNLRTMFGLKVPIISIVIGEGGSGGALAIGCANKLLMLENAVFYVASPEACAAILWKTSKAAPKAAEKLRITAKELCKLKIADGIIPEPLGGAHTDPSWTSQQIKIAVAEAMKELLEMDTPKLLEHRMLKYRALGGFQEIPQDPEKKINMKKKKEPIVQKEEQNTSAHDLAEEVDKLRQKIHQSKDSSSQLPELGLDEMIERLKREVDQEFFEAIKSMGLKEQLDTLRKEFAQTRGSADLSMDSVIIDRIEKLKQEFNQGLSQASNFESLSYKLDMLKELSKEKELSERNVKIASLKQEINKRLKEAIEQSDLKEKIEKLKTEAASSASADGSIDPLVKEKIVNVKKEIQLKLSAVLKSLDLDIEVASPRQGGLEEYSQNGQPLLSDLKSKIKELNDEINAGIEDAVNSSDLKRKVEMLRLEVAKAGKTADPDSENKINVLKQQIKQSLVEVLNTPELAEKHERLKQEIERAKESYASELNVKPAALNEGILKQDISRVEVTHGHNVT